MFIDSHCHVNYLDNPADAIAYARQANVDTMLCIGVDQAGCGDVLALADQHADIWATVGEHPGNASSDQGWIAAKLDHPRVVAVGEMGLDYFYTDDVQIHALQQQSFRHQMQLAQDNNLPVVVHTRQACEDTLAVLADFPAVRGVLHCFTETWDMAAAAMEMGYFVSISGIVTFRQADNVREVAQRIPSHRLLIETDSPWLAPVPYRGKQNQPGYVAATAAYLAELRGESVAQLAATTSDNFYELFSRAQRG